MENVVLLVVLLGWVGAGAWWIAGRRNEPVGDAMGDFKNQLDSLERRNAVTASAWGRYVEDPTMPRELSEPKPMLSDTTRRRGEILLGLLFGAVLCGLIGTLPALRALWLFAVLFLLLAMTYGGIIWRRHTLKQRQEDERWFRAYGRRPGQGAAADGYFDEHGNWWQAEAVYNQYGQPLYDQYGQQVFQYVPVATAGAGYRDENYISAGYNAEGFDVYGYDREGYDRYGYDRDGFDRDGYDAYGYDPEGYDRDGYPFEASDDDEYELFWQGRGQQWQDAQVYNLNDWRPEYRQAANY